MAPLPRRSAFNRLRLPPSRLPAPRPRDPPFCKCSSGFPGPAPWVPCLRVSQGMPSLPRWLSDRRLEKAPGRSPSHGNLDGGDRCVHPCSPHLGLCRASGNPGPPPNALSSPHLSPEHRTLTSSYHLSTGCPQVSCLTPKPGHQSQGMDGRSPSHTGPEAGHSVSYSPMEPSANPSPPRPARFSRAGRCPQPRPPAAWVLPGPCLSRLSSRPSRLGDTGAQGPS